MCDVRSCSGFISKDDDDEGIAVKLFRSPFQGKGQEGAKKASKTKNLHRRNRVKILYFV